MAAESLADYQKAVIEMIEANHHPFERPFFELSALRHELGNRRYNRFGDKGLSDVLRQHGFNRYRGRKRIGGILQTTPNFWAVTTLQDETESGVYDWYTRVAEEDAEKERIKWRCHG